MQLEELKGYLEKAWSRDTSADPAGWSENNPAWGQCAVTALVVQDYFGGELLRGMFVGGLGPPVSHYWNGFTNASMNSIDLTLGQFGHAAGLITAGEVRTREYVLSFPATAARYELLKQRVRDARIT